MYGSLGEESFMKNTEDISYQRTSTRIAPMRPVIPIMENGYDGWVNRLNETPKELKVRGTTRILVGIISGMVSIPANGAPYGYLHGQGHFTRIADPSLYPWYGYQQVPPVEAFGGCNCGNC